MPPGPVYFPEGQQSDQPLELLIAELVREQALRLTRDEVPHAIAAEVTSITERDDRPLVEIEANVIVETESQKAIVVGKGGRVVKAIGSGARHEIEAILGRAGVPRPARQGAQALASRRPLHRAPPLGAAAGSRLLYSRRLRTRSFSRPEEEALQAEELAKTIDHTLLRADATSADVETLCAEAAKYHFAAVCLFPHFVPLAAGLLRGTRRQDLHRHLVPVRRRYAEDQGAGRRRGGAARAPTRWTSSSTCRRSSRASSGWCATSSPPSCTRCACAGSTPGAGR